MTTTAEQKVMKAKRALMTDPQWVFFSVLLSTKKVEVKEPQGRTAWTNGSAVLFDSKYVDETPTSHVMGVLAHELLHIAFDHVGEGPRAAKSKGLDMARVNKACDYAINPIVIESGLKLPEGALFDPAFKGMRWEEIYHLLPQEQEEEDDFQQDLDPDGEKGKEEGEQGAPGGEQEGGDQSSAGNAGEEEGDERVLLAQAYAAAKIAGATTAGIDLVFQEMFAPEVDWQEQLAEFVRAPAKEDWTWSRPGRRTFPNIITPELYSERVGHGVIVIDSSGSVARLAPVFLQWVAAIMRDVRPEGLTVMSCDTEVYNVEELSWMEPIEEYQVRGGGGTSFKAPFRYLDENVIQPDFLIYLTDLLGAFPSSPPTYPVLWVSTLRGKEAPFGKTIYADLSN